MKTCLNCRNKKPSNEFNKSKGKRRCDECMDGYGTKGSREYRNAEMTKWRRNNPEKWADVQRRGVAKKVANNPNYHKELYQKNIASNPNVFRNQKRRDNYNNRRKNDPQFRMKEVLKARLGAAIRDQGGIKSEKTLALIGCDLPFFIKYIESQFTPEMNWQNHGSYFSIDHIIPCDFFDLTNEIHQKVCFCYLNLQPLEKDENRRKSNKILNPEHLQVILNHLNISIDDFTAKNRNKRREAEAV